MNDRVKELFKLVDKAHDEIFTEMIKLEDELPETDIYEATDWVYAFREMADKLRTIRVKADVMKINCQNLACALYVVQGPNSPIIRDGNIKTGHCTGTPDLKQGAHIPKLKKDPEGYYAVMDYLGIPKGIVEKDLVRPHWPSVVDHLSELASLGKPMPPGIDPTKTYPVYDMVVRRKKGVSE